MALLLIVEPLGQTVDPDRMSQRLEQLSEFGRTEAGGLNRVAFSAHVRNARRFLRRQLEAAGAVVQVDAAGNLVARVAGTIPSLPPIAFGSHLDSVPDGGRFDGNAGVLAALEIIESLSAANYKPRHPLEFVVFSDEESSMVGSRAWAGDVTEAILKETGHAGLTIEEGLARLDGQPSNLRAARRKKGALTAFLELHIEQGAILDSRGDDIGVVEGIVGIKWWDVTVDGQANHAGTTPMNRRRDALLAAARFVEAVHRIVTSRAGSQVGTVGRLVAEPGAPNVVVGRVRMSLELRDLSMSVVDSLYEVLEQEAAEIGLATGTAFTFTLLDATAHPALTDPQLQQLIETAARALGLKSHRMPSGAGHDAQNIAALAPIGMIFVPSRDGISHAPGEFTSVEQLARGTQVLLKVILELDRR